MCDWAYLLLTEQIRALALAERTALLTAAAMSGGDVDLDGLPDPEAAVRRLDELLVLEAGDTGELAGMSPEDADLLIGLGLRR